MSYSERSSDARETDSLISPSNEPQDDDEHTLGFEAPAVAPSPVLALMSYFLFVLGQTFIATANIDVLLGLICRDEFAGIIGLYDGLYISPECREIGSVAAKVTNFSSYDQIIGGILGVLIIPKLAGMSDKIGRKPLLMWGGFSAAVNDLIRLLCLMFPEKISYRWLILAYVFKGSGGSCSPMQLLNGIYIADTTAAENRSQMLGVLDAVFFGAVALGPFLGSVFISIVPNYTAMFGITLGCDLLYFVLTTFVVAESRSKEARYESHIDPQNHSTWNIFKPLTKLTFKHIRNRVRRRNAISLVAIMAVVSDISLALGPILVLYSEFRFKWSAVETGFLLTTFGTARVAVLGVLYPLLTKLLNRLLSPKDSHNLDRIDMVLVRMGLAISMICFCGIGAAPTGGTFFMAIVGESLAGILVPTLKNSLIKYIEPANLGQVMGSVSFLTNISMVVITKAAYKVFEWSVSAHPQLVFEMGSIAFVGLFLFSFILKPNLSDYEDV